MRKSAFFLALLCVTASFPVSYLFSQPALPIADGLGAFWNISSSRIQKIDVQGNVLQTYSNISLGAPATIDTSDPFRILVFYKESQQIVTLNSDAAIIGTPFNISELFLGEITQVCRSARGGFWIFQRESSEVIHFDEKFKPTGAKFSVIPNSPNAEIDFMVEHKGTIYLGLSGKKIARYDIYGAEQPSVELPYGSIRFENDFVWICHNKTISKYDLKNFLLIPESLQCSCEFLPITVKQDVMCFDGEKFKLCIKN